MTKSSRITVFSSCLFNIELSELESSNVIPTTSEETILRAWVGGVASVVVCRSVSRVVVSVAIACEVCVTKVVDSV